MPFRVLQALCGAALWSSDFGPSIDRFRWFSFHLLLRICFDGLLRPKEFFNLRTEDVCISPFDGSQAVLILRETKTQATMGSLQHVILLDPRNVQFLRWHLEGLSPGSPVWAFSENAARTCLKQVLAICQLSDSSLTLGSLRAGGATHLYTSGMEVSRLLFRGRWRVLGTLHCYIQEATCAMVLLQFRPAAIDRVTRLAQLAQAHQVPATPLWVLCGFSHALWVGPAIRGRPQLAH